MDMISCIHFRKGVINMLLDLAMIITLVVGFGLVKLFTDWCAKQIKN